MAVFRDLGSQMSWWAGREVYIGDDGGYDSGYFFFDRTCGSCLFYPMGFLSNLVLHIFSCSFLFLSSLLCVGEYPSVSISRNDVIYSCSPWSRVVICRVYTLFWGWVAMTKDETIAAARIGKAVSQIKRSMPFPHSPRLFPRAPLFSCPIRIPLLSDPDFPKKRKRP